MQYLIAFYTYLWKSLIPSSYSSAPLCQNMGFSHCDSTTETGNGECLSTTLLCDSVSNKRGRMGEAECFGVSLVV